MWAYFMGCEADGVPQTSCICGCDFTLAGLLPNGIHYIKETSQRTPENHQKINFDHEWISPDMQNLHLKNPVT